jgi:hypothetical protein
MVSLRVWIVGVGVAAAAGCNGGGAAQQVSSGSSSSSAPATAASSAALPSASGPGEPEDKVPWVGIPHPVDEVEKVLNPEGKAPYTGKTGTVRGRITATGDPPPETGLAIPADCPDAREAYKTAFRVSPKGGAVDALVTVTGAKEFVPVKTPAVAVKIKGCAFDQTAYALTFGQRLEIQNLDAIDSKLSYIPFLDPAPYRSVNVALPQGRPVKVYAFQPAVNYVLRDYMKRPFLTARVFVLKFSTHDITDGDGNYVIENVPVGPVQVDAFFPALDDEGATKKIEVKEGDNVVDLTLHYDKAKDKLVGLDPDPWKRGSTTAPTASGKFGTPPALPPKGQEPH